MIGMRLNLNLGHHSLNQMALTFFHNYKSLKRFKMSKQPEYKLYTKEQRQKIYEMARIHFMKYNAVDPTEYSYWSRMTRGMCYSIDRAVCSLRNKNKWAWRPSKKEYLPEYFAFQPKTLWREDSDYWFTRYYKRGGYYKRLSLLTALVAGKSVDQWKKEWEVEKKELAKEWAEDK